MEGFHLFYRIKKIYDETGSNDPEYRNRQEKGGRKWKSYLPAPGQVHVLLDED